MAEQRISDYIKHMFATEPSVFRDTDSALARQNRGARHLQKPEEAAHRKQAQ